MCGLFACFSSVTKVSNLSLGKVRACLDSMEHRGPDNSGIAYISKDEVYCQAVVSDLEKFQKHPR